MKKCALTRAGVGHLVQYTNCIPFINLTRRVSHKRDLSLLFVGIVRSYLSGNHKTWTKNRTGNVVFVLTSHCFASYCTISVIQGDNNLWCAGSCETGALFATCWKEAFMLLDWEQWAVRITANISATCSLQGDIVLFSNAKVDSQQMIENLSELSLKVGLKISIQKLT